MLTSRIQRASIPTPEKCPKGQILALVKQFRKKHNLSCAELMEFLGRSPDECAKTDNQLVKELTLQDIKLLTNIMEISVDDLMKMDS